MSIRPDPGGNGTAVRFRSDERTQGVFPAELLVDPDVPHRVSLVVHGFNELDRSVYTGYAFTRGVVGIAGAGDWKGSPFGFCARRQTATSPGPEQQGALTSASFLGRWDVWCDGQHAALDLSDLTGDDGLTGVLVDGGAAFPVSAVVGPAVPHQAQLTVHGTGEPLDPVMTVWLSTRPRTALAGWTDWGPTRLGCCLTRCSWAGRAH